MPTRQRHTLPHRLGDPPVDGVEAERHTLQDKGFSDAAIRTILAATCDTSRKVYKFSSFLVRRGNPRGARLGFSTLDFPNHLYYSSVGESIPDLGHDWAHPQYQAACLRDWLFGLPPYISSVDPGAGSVVTCGLCQACLYSRPLQGHWYLHRVAIDISIKPTPSPIQLG